MSYSFTLDVIYNLCVYTKDFARKVKRGGFMSGNSKRQFGWQVKNLNTVLSGGKWEMKQGRECRMVNYTNFAIELFQILKLFPKVKERNSDKISWGFRHTYMLCSHCLEGTGPEYSNNQASLHNLHFLWTLVL